MAYRDVGESSMLLYKVIIDRLPRVAVGDVFIDGARRVGGEV